MTRAGQRDLTMAAGGSTSCCGPVGASAASRISAAERHCAARGLRFTELRRSVFAALAGSPRALGAYDLIHAVGQEGRRLSPISVYRALDFLVAAGLVHRITSRNAFIACPHHHHADDTVVFLLCEGCGRVEEGASAPVTEGLAALSRQHGFTIRERVLEISGHCAACGGSGQGLGVDQGIATA